MDDKRKLAIYEELARYLVKNLNMFNGSDMLDGYLDSLMDGDEVFEPNMALEELGLPTLDHSGKAWDAEGNEIEVRYEEDDRETPPVGRPPDRYVDMEIGQLLSMAEVHGVSYLDTDNQLILRMRLIIALRAAKVID